MDHFAGLDVSVKETSIWARPVGERPLIPVTAKAHYSLGVALFFVSAPSPPDARCSARTARRS
jgi:hypothetical protein